MVDFKFVLLLVSWNIFNSVSWINNLFNQLELMEYLANILCYTPILHNII